MLLANTLNTLAYNFYRKHQKRHSKPYGCTFADCKKTFGSKNDWKRHESIQHYQLETWICDCAKSDSAESCGKVCYRRESFRNHLSKEHEITDTSKLEEKVEGCRKGRHCDAHFWCGFCQETVEIKETDNTWAKRCDHIDDHFSGRRVPKKDISEWIHEKDHRIVPSAPQVDESGSSSGSSPSDPISPQSTVSTENSGEDRRGRKKDMYMWTCVSRAPAQMPITTKLTHSNSVIVLLKTVSATTRCVASATNVRARIVLGTQFHLQATVSLLSSVRQCYITIGGYSLFCSYDANDIPPSCGQV